MAGFWRKFLRGPVGRVTMRSARPAARFSVVVPPEMQQGMTAGGTIEPRISRDQALQVPAVLRARNLICGSLGSLPIRVHGPDRAVVENVQYIVPQPDPDVATSVVMAQTIEDLLFEGIAWWHVTRWGWHNYPVEARLVPATNVFVSPDGTVYVEGRPVQDKEIIRIDSPNPGLLTAAARAIRTCQMLDQTAAMYAKDPIPLGYFTPDENAETLQDEEIQQILDDWQAARRRQAWGFVNGGLKAQSLAFNPEQLQLADQRQHAVLEIARAAGVDPEDLGVSTTSRTYANSEQRRQDLIDFTLGPYVSAIQDRLSMRDVLPRGYIAKIDFAGFLRGDTKTRMETYSIGLGVGAYTTDEIRDLEDRPRLTAAQRAAAQPAPMPSTQQTEAPPAAARNTREETPVTGRQQFAADERTVRLQFEAPPAQDFQVDTQRRTVTGLMLPWGKVADNGWAKWRFQEGSVNWSETSRIKLNLHHNSTELIGVATRLQSGRAGLTGTFKLGRGSAADSALQDAEDGILDGFSVEVDFDDPDAWQPDPTDESVRLVRHANLRGAALTGTPAFDDARLTSVKASRREEPTTLKTASVTKDQPDAAFDFDGYMSGLANKITESHLRLTEQLAGSIGESVAAGVKTALEDLPSPQDGPQTVRAARFTVVREEPVYAFNGSGNSLVRDAWYAARERDHDALERLRRYRSQTEEVAKLAQAQLFTTATTGNVSQVIPPGYRPDLYVTQLQQGRPMVAACSQGTISNATPFVVPIFSSVTGATADHVEGVNPTDGTITFTTKTVTPGAISGRLVLTREIVDSSNPAIDQIALAAMRESYARQTEAKVYTLLNGANGAGGVITAGLVPSGAQAATYVGLTGTPPALIGGIRARLAAYPFNRFAAPGIALMGQNATTVLATATDSTGRPIFPSIGASNTAGIGNAYTQGWNVDGLAFVPAWAITGTAAGDTQIFILNQSDAWVWESPLLTFRYEEKSGPAMIELALFGYFATHLLRPVGLSGIRIT